MGSNIKALRNRIKSVQSTLHLTRAMGLVASSKVRKANENRIKSADFKNSVATIINVLSSSTEAASSGYFGSKGEKTKIILIAGDRGLAGGYNAGVLKLAKEHIAAEIYPIGKKACERYGKVSASSEQFTYDDALSLANSLCAEFKSGELARVGVIYTKYVSLMTQEPTLVWLLPLEKPEKSDTAGTIFEPSEKEALEAAIPTYVAGTIYSLIKESFACEVIARQNAMDSAGKNAEEMLDELGLQYNRARQGAITQEITEIVAGSGE